MSISAELQALIDSTCELPPIPIVAGRIVSLASDPNTDATVLEQAILADQSLTANILKLANSSFYGCIRTVNSVASAIVIIGFMGIKNLVIASSLKSILKRVTLIEKMLWEHSVCSGVAAHILSNKLFFPPEEAFVGGLIHDIGKVILNNQMNELFSEIVQISYNEEIPLVEVEKERLGFTHAEVGGVMIRKWNLSSIMEEAVTYHHNLDGIDPSKTNILSFTAILNLTNKICAYLGIGYRRPTEDIDFQNLKSVQILNAGELFPELIEEVKDKYEVERANF